MTTSEKVAYLKGLMEGMKLDKDSDEGKLFSVIADILADMAEDIEDVESDLCDLSEDVDAISDDLSDVEDYLCDEDDDYCGCCCDDEDEDEDEDEDDEDEEPMFFEVTCPSCNKTITIDEDVLNLGSIQCPNCGEMLEFDFDEKSKTAPPPGVRRAGDFCIFIHFLSASLPPPYCTRRRRCRGRGRRRRSTAGRTRGIPRWRRGRGRRRWR